MRCDTTSDKGHSTTADVDTMPRILALITPALAFSKSSVYENRLPTDKLSHEHRQGLCESRVRSQFTTVYQLYKLCAFG
jgi:hypothetical protein